MPKIELLIGMIASGKSTYARQRADEGAMIVCHDDLSEMLHGRYGFKQDLRECYRLMEESLVWRILNAGCDAIVDRTHLTRESRKRWIKWVRDHDSLNDYGDRGIKTPIVAVTFPILDFKTHAACRLRADPRGRTYQEWLKVAEHHAAQAKAEPLDWKAEGFTNCVTITPETLARLT